MFSDAIINGIDFNCPVFLFLVYRNIIDLSIWTLYLETLLIPDLLFVLCFLLFPLNQFYYRSIAFINIFKELSLIFNSSLFCFFLLY